MLFGYTLQIGDIVAMGIAVFALLALQVLQGMRVIRLKGRMHLKVHRIAGWATGALAALHGFIALVYANGWSVF